MTIIKDKAQFAAVRSSTSKNATVIRNNVQDMLVFGFKQYLDHGNISFLTSVRKLATSSRLIPAIEVVTYVERYANVTWNQAANAFKSKNNKDRGVKVLETKWFDNINKEKDAPVSKPTDILKMVKSLAKQVAKKGENNLLNDDDKHVEMADALLTQFISSLEARGFTETKA